MTEYISVKVQTETDDNGLVKPNTVVYENVHYPITRILHISQPDDSVTAYTILIGNKHRKLMFNGADWRISSALAK